MAIVRQMTYTQKLRDEICALELKEVHLEVKIKRLKSVISDLKEQNKVLRNQLQDTYDDLLSIKRIVE